MELLADKIPVEKFEIVEKRMEKFVNAVSETAVPPARFLKNEALLTIATSELCRSRPVVLL